MIHLNFIKMELERIEELEKFEKICETKWKTDASISAYVQDWISISQPMEPATINYQEGICIFYGCFQPYMKCEQRFS